MFIVPPTGREICGQVPTDNAEPQFRVKSMPGTNGTRQQFVASAFIAAAILLLLCGSTFYFRKSKEVESAHVRGKLGRIRLAIIQWNSERGSLRRVTTDDQGKEVGWRCLIAPLLENELSQLPPNQGLAGCTSFSAPGNLRIAGDGGSANWTSFVAVYEAGAEQHPSNEIASGFSVIAIRQSGIPWNSSRDFTAAEFESILWDRLKKGESIEFLSRDGKIGTFQGPTATYYGDAHSIIEHLK